MVSASAGQEIEREHAIITIGDNKVKVAAGEVVVMPADIPHALDAEENFKMLLTMVKA